MAHLKGRSLSGKMDGPKEQISFWRKPHLGSRCHVLFSVFLNVTEVHFPVVNDMSVENRSNSGPLWAAVFRQMKGHCRKSFPVLWKREKESQRTLDPKTLLKPLSMPNYNLRVIS